MKKTIILLLSLTLMTSLVGCGAKKNTTKQAGSGHSNVTLTIDSSSPQGTDDNSGSQSVDNGKLPNPDIDLSMIGSSLIYTKATEIASNYSSYLGKIIKIKGNFQVEKGQSRNYYYCSVTDPTACCNAGFEFVLKDSSITYPKGYPAENAEFVVQGKLSSYQEGNNTYLELREASIIK